MLYNKCKEGWIEMMMKKRVIVMGAAGRDFHNFSYP